MGIWINHVAFIFPLQPPNFSVFPFKCLKMLCLFSRYNILVNASIQINCNHALYSTTKKASLACAGDALCQTGFSAHQLFGVAVNADIIEVSGGFDPAGHTFRAQGGLHEGTEIGVDGGIMDFRAIQQHADG